MKTLRQRFDAKVDRSGGPDACWNWTASTVFGGYGQIGRGRAGTGNAMAHRLAWEFEHGAIADDLQVLHRCDNRRCCNPRHLFLGTQADNIADMHAKKRNNQPRGRHGETAPFRSLDDAAVLEIRRLYETTMTTQNDLASRFGVSQSTISSIILRRSWPHL